MGKKKETLTSILGKDKKSVLQRKIEDDWKRKGAMYRGVEVKATYLKPVKNGHLWRIEINW